MDGESERLFFMLGGRLGCWDGCGSGRCNGFSCVLGVSSLFFDIYLAFSVRASGCLVHGFVQFWLQFCWQKVALLYVVQFFQVLSVFYSIFRSLLGTLSLCH